MQSCLSELGACCSALRRNFSICFFKMLREETGRVTGNDNTGPTPGTRHLGECLYRARYGDSACRFRREL